VAALQQQVATADASHQALAGRVHVCCARSEHCCMPRVL
jgi:hypothetical protein